MNKIRRAVRSAMMRRLAIAGVATAVMGSGLVAVTTVGASAHTPNASASCSGVHLGATSYDSHRSNKWSVTIAGQTQNGTFGSSLDETFPVPQNGATTEWSATIQAYDGSYKRDFGGKVGPCGTPTSKCVKKTPTYVWGPSAVSVDGAQPGTWLSLWDAQDQGHQTLLGKVKVNDDCKAVVTVPPAECQPHQYQGDLSSSEPPATITDTDGDGIADVPGWIAGELFAVPASSSESCWPMDAAASVTVLPGTCTSPGSASVGDKQFADLNGVLDQSVGSHAAPFTSWTGHRFSNGTTSLQVPYTIEGKDTSKHCNQQPPACTHKCPVPDTKHHSKGNVVCNGTIRGGVYDNVRVKRGASCQLINVHVNKDVTANGAKNVSILDTTVVRTIDLNKVRNTIKIGNKNGCKYDPQVGRSIYVSNSHNVLICEMTVCEDISLQGNDGQVTVRNSSMRRLMINNTKKLTKPYSGHHRRLQDIRVLNSRGLSFTHHYNHKSRKVVTRGSVFGPKQFPG